MEAAMHKSLATIAATLAILCGAVLLSDSAQAGASASAPSKYSRSSQVAAAQQTNRHAHRNDFGITEYSSSSAKNAPQR
jgi:preprotein translocase subunit SecG